MSIDRPSRIYPAEDLNIPPVVETQPDRRTCVIGDIELHYLVWGDRAKPPVVLVHGGKDHCRNWDWTVAALIDDYCCITPDMRGHGDSGRSAGGGYSTELFVSDFAFFMEHLGAEGFAQPLDLIGHSMGGNIVLHYAAAYPEKVSRLISMEGLGSSQKMYDEFMEKLPAKRLRDWIDRRVAGERKQKWRFKNPEEMVERMATVHKNLRLDQSRHLALHAARLYPDGWGWKHDPRFGFFPPPKLTAPEEYSRLYESITCPVLLMRGEDSWASDPVEDGRINAFSDARLINYPEAGHWHHHDQFDAFIKDVKDFLDQ
ncbi:MAG: alpha/beta hydrolase [Aquisalinus sp.]|nr:alpha/beta hydrolase [Aquisalinus sp.]